MSYYEISIFFGTLASLVGVILIGVVFYLNIIAGEKPDHNQAIRLFYKWNPDNIQMLELLLRSLIINERSLARLSEIEIHLYGNAKKLDESIVLKGICDEDDIKCRVYHHDDYDNNFIKIKIRSNFSVAKSLKQFIDMQRGREISMREEDIVLAPSKTEYLIEMNYVKVAAQ